MIDFWRGKLRRALNTNGLTLIEIVGVLVILAVIMLIAIPSISQSIDKANTEVCITNRIELERSYEMILSMENLKHNEGLFIEHVGDFQGSICPLNGVITYNDGKVECNIHNEQEHEEEHQEEVPFL